MKKIQKLSVVIPTIGRNILSIKEILKYKIKLIIVIHDNIFFKKKFIQKYSNEIRQKKIQVFLVNKKVGINKVRYFGAIKAKTKYILFVDDDDSINGKQLVKINKLLNQKETDLIISDYKLRFKKKNIILSPLIEFFGKYSPFVKTITPGGGTIYNKKIIKYLYKYDFKRFEDWCIGIILIYKLKKEFLLNKNVFYYVNYKEKKNKKFFNTLQFRFNYSKTFGIIPLIHSTISYAISQIFLRKLK